MSFKVADGYVEVHARHDRSSTRRNAKQAVDDAEGVAKSREGSMLKWLFKTNPKLMRFLEAPIGHIFGSPIVFGAAAAFAAAVSGLLATAISSALLLALGGGFIAAAIWGHHDNQELIKNAEKLKDRIFSVLKRASEPLIGPMMRAMDMIGDAFERWEPSLNRIYKALAPIVEPFTGGVLGFLESMLPGIERAMPGINAVFLAFADHLPGFGTAIGDFFATIAENEDLLVRVVGLMFTWLDIFFKVLGPLLVGLMAEFAQVGDAWNTMTTLINMATEWIGDTWGKIPGWWNKTWGAVKNWFSDLGKSISGFFKSTGDGTSQWWNSTWGSVSGWFSDLGSDIGKFFSDTWSSITNWWNNQTSSIANWWNSTWEQVATWFSLLPGRIMGFFADLPRMMYDMFLDAFDQVYYVIGYGLGLWVGAMALLPDMVWGILVDMFNNWKEGVGITFDWIVNTITSRWNTAIDFWGKVPGRILAFMQSWYHSTREGIQIIMDWIVNYIVSGWNRGINFWRTVPGQIMSIVGGMAVGVVNRIIGMFTSIYQWWDALPGRLASAAGSAWRQVQDWFNWGLRTIPALAINIANNVLAAVRGLGAHFYNAGLDAIRGLVNGIEAMMGWAIDMAWRAAKRIRDGFLDALGIRSPSKVMADEVGKWIPKGIMVGIEDNMGDLDRFAADFPDTFTSGMVPTSSSNTNDNSTNYGNITIEVHIDNIQELEDIKAFLDGRMRNNSKAREWSGNLFEQQGEYVRSYQ